MTDLIFRRADGQKTGSRPVTLTQITVLRKNYTVSSVNVSLHRGKGLVVYYLEFNAIPIEAGRIEDLI